MGNKKQKKLKPFFNEPIQTFQEGAKCSTFQERLNRIALHWPRIKVRTARDLATLGMAGMDTMQHLTLKKLERLGVAPDSVKEIMEMVDQYLTRKAELDIENRLAQEKRDKLRKGN